MIQNKIPKIIHYCWFGGSKKTDLAEGCIKSWREKLPDYKIIEWNEDNFDISMNSYVEEAYKNKKYAFVSDYVRLYALYNYGGIYMDTDVQVIKKFDDLLLNEGFMGFEDKELISTAVIGASKGNQLIKEWMETYKNRHFFEKGKMNTITNVRVITNFLLDCGLKQNNTIQTIEKGNFIIYPIEYFSPLKLGKKEPNITSNSITIHWFEGTWLSGCQLVKIKFINIVKAIIGFKNYNKIKCMIKNNKSC